MQWLFLHFYVILNAKSPIFSMQMFLNCPERQINFLTIFLCKTILMYQQVVFPLWEIKSTSIYIIKSKIFWWLLVDCGRFWYFLNGVILIKSHYNCSDWAIKSTNIYTTKTWRWKIKVSWCISSWCRRHWWCDLILKMMMMM